MASSCRHLCKPSAAVTARLLDPTRWYCDTCQSTDGCWVCLSCGHAGCSREANLGPGIGGGHALHHALTHAGCKGACVIDVVSRHTHCYECDDYVIEDPPWFSSLRSRIEGLVPTPPPPIDDPDSPFTIDTPVTPGHTGLTNLGNTCFMNSTMQLLANLCGFRSFFRDVSALPHSYSRLRDLSLPPARSSSPAHLPPCSFSASRPSNRSPSARNRRCSSSRPRATSASDLSASCARRRACGCQSSRRRANQRSLS